MQKNRSKGSDTQKPPSGSKGTAHDAKELLLKNGVSSIESASEKAPLDNSAANFKNGGLIRLSDGRQIPIYLQRKTGLPSHAIKVLKHSLRLSVGFSLYVVKSLTTAPVINKFPMGAQIVPGGNTFNDANTPSPDTEDAQTNPNTNSTARTTRQDAAFDTTFNSNAAEYNALRAKNLILNSALTSTSGDLSLWLGNTLPNHQEFSVAAVNLPNANVVIDNEQIRPANRPLAAAATLAFMDAQAAQQDKSLAQAKSPDMPTNTVNTANVANDVSTNTAKTPVEPAPATQTSSEVSKKGSLSLFGPVDKAESQSTSQSSTIQADAASNPAPKQATQQAREPALLSSTVNSNNTADSPIESKANTPIAEPTQGTGVNTLASPSTEKSSIDSPTMGANGSNKIPGVAAIPSQNKENVAPAPQIQTNPSETQAVQAESAPSQASRQTTVQTTQPSPASNTPLPAIQTAENNKTPVSKAGVIKPQAYPVTSTAGVPLQAAETMASNAALQIASAAIARSPSAAVNSSAPIADLAVPLTSSVTSSAETKAAKEANAEDTVKAPTTTAPTSSASATSPSNAITTATAVPATPAPNKPAAPVASTTATVAPTSNTATPTAAAPGKDAAPSADAGGAVDFDAGALKTLGISPSVAAYFKEAPRFQPGVHTITLKVNGDNLGLANARFDDKGKLCFDKALLNKGGIILPAAASDKKVSSGSPFKPSDSAQWVSQDPSCINFLEIYPTTVINLKPNDDIVELIVPTSALAPTVEASTPVLYTSGGTAGLINYNFSTNKNQSTGSSSNSFTGDMEFGLNTHDWLLRHRTTVSESDGSRQISNLYTYAQHTIPKYDSIFQTGQLNINNPIFSGSPILGFQLSPEEGLSKPADVSPVVNGVAQTQSRIEVRQAGTLIYSTIVPAGPFNIKNIQLLNRNADLAVSIIDSSGRTRQFTVPAASFRGAVTQPTGFTFSLGKVDDAGGGNTMSSRPLVASLGKGWSLNNNANLTTGYIFTTKYQGVGGQLDASLGKEAFMSFRNQWSNSLTEHVLGSQSSLSMGTVLSESFSVTGSVTTQTINYRELLDTLQTTPTDNSGNYKIQYSASATWSNSVLGGFSVGYGQSNSFNGLKTRNLFATWGKTFKNVTPSLSVQHSSSNNSTSQSGTYIYLSLSVSLGKQSISSYWNKSNGAAQYGLSTSGQFNDYVNYAVDAGWQAQSSNSGSYSANLGILPRYTQLGLLYSQSDSSSHSYGANLNGSAVIHKEGITFSPYTINDTFGIAVMDEHIAGIQISTPGSTVWTDAGGRAIIPELTPYKVNRIEVVTKSLPKNVDIVNGYTEINPGRGSFTYADFDVNKVRRVLLNAKDSQQKPLALGLAVMDQHNHYVTTVVNNGMIFLNNYHKGEQFHVLAPSGETQCTLNFTASEKTKLDSYYETLEAECR